MKEQLKRIETHEDAFEEVAAIFAASGIEITAPMIELMKPLMDGSQSFEEHRLSLKAELEKIAQ